jgi:hypothetical protein
VAPAADEFAFFNHLSFSSAIIGSVQRLRFQEEPRAMAVCWRCPSCSEVSCEDDVHVTGNAVACDHCERPFTQQETLCTVCDTPNPWTRRDTLHFLCRECGTAQTYFSHLPMAG